MHIAGFPKAMVGIISKFATTVITTKRKATASATGILPVRLR